MITPMHVKRKRREDPVGNNGKTVPPGNGNLKSWKPGQSGNPKGRPKGAKTGLRARLARLLNNTAPDKWAEIIKAYGFKMDDATIADVVGMNLVREAICGDNPVPAAKLLFEQTEYKLEEGKQSAEVNVTVVSPTIDLNDINNLIPVEVDPLGIENGNGHK